MPPVIDRRLDGGRIEEQFEWAPPSCLVARVHASNDFYRHAGHRVTWRYYWRRPLVAQAFEARSTSASDDLVEEFESLADRWETETAFESVVVRKAMNPAYQRIIGMGPRVIPLILRRLEQEPRQWFWALTALSGEDPAAGSDTVDDAAHAWLAWGKARGLIS